MRCYKV